MRTFRRFIILVILVALSVPALANAQAVILGAHGVLDDGIEREHRTLSARLWVVNGAPATFCTIFEGNDILAVARAADNGSILAFTASPECDGLVRIGDGQGVVWRNPAALDELPTFAVPEPPPPLSEADSPEAYAAICQAATLLSPSEPPADPPLQAWFPAEYRADFPAHAVADALDDATVIACMAQQEMVVRNCTYDGGRTLQRVRLDLDIKLLNISDGHILNQRTFAGDDPDPCPLDYEFAEGSTFEQLLGPPPASEDYVAWTVRVLSGDRGRLYPRTVITEQFMNVLAQPDVTATPVGRLRSGDPVTLLARSPSGNWVVGLIPNMTIGWLQTATLRPATQVSIGELPVADSLPQGSLLPFVLGTVQ